MGQTRRKANLHRNELNQKQCNYCSGWKNETEYYRDKNTPDGFARQCKVCRRFSHIFNKYNVTQDVYWEMYNAQNGVCQGCKQTKDEDFCIDHDHACCSGDRSCGKCVRGLVCIACNLILGYAYDNPEILRTLATYLEERCIDRA